ncbi:MAG: hypothetical protein M3N54_16020 [Acidobacteriota bacterium]|nr:hypothetical protein [Acidobacteriota bacterium]
MRIILTSALAAGSLLLGGCSSDPAPAASKTPAVRKGPVIPTGPITALTAYYEMYKVARNWAPDVQTASLTGSDAGDVKGAEGKFPKWTAIFVSPSKQMSQTYTYSTVEEGSTLKGFNNEGSKRWAGASQAAEPFSNSDFSVDSDAAWKAASEKAKDWLAKNPGKEITAFALGHSSRFPVPMWYILWGTKASGYAAFVNASTGKIFGK